MPSKSIPQRKLFAYALAYKQGKAPEAPDNIKKLSNSMTEDQLKHYLVVVPKNIEPTERRKRNE